MLRSKFAARSFWFTLAGLLLAVTLTAPHRLAAQEAAPTSTQAPAAQTPPAPATEAAKAGQQKSEDEDAKFLESPAVHTMARVLHLDFNTAKWLFLILNFAIIAGAIVIPLVRVMPKIIRKRSQTLKHDLEEARRTTLDANTRLSAIEAKLAGLDKEIAEMRTHMEEEGKHDEARIKATIEEESSRIVAAAEQEITAAAAHARRGLRHFAADLAIEQAAKQLVLTPETDRALIAEFVSEAGKNGTSGRQN